MAEAGFPLTVRTPTGVVFEGPVQSLTVLTPEGFITVLAHHMPLVTLLSEGEMRITAAGQERTLVLEGGFLQIDTDGATVLSDFAAEAESIEVGKVEEAKKAAEELRAQQRERGDLALVERDLQRAVLQLKVAERYRSRRTPKE